MLCCFWVNVFFLQKHDKVLLFFWEISKYFVDSSKWNFLGYQILLVMGKNISIWHFYYVISRFLSLLPCPWMLKSDQRTFLAILVLWELWSIPDKAWNTEPQLAMNFLWRYFRQYHILKCGWKGKVGNELSTQEANISSIYSSKKNIWKVTRSFLERLSMWDKIVVWCSTSDIFH